MSNNVNSVPVEITSDVLKFLPRNDAEGCQLVSKKFNLLVLNHLNNSSDCKSFKIEKYLQKFFIYKRRLQFVIF